LKRKESKWGKRNSGGPFNKDGGGKESRRRKGRKTGRRRSEEGEAANQKGRNTQIYLQGGQKGRSLKKKKGGKREEEGGNGIYGRREERATREIFDKENYT